MQSVRDMEIRGTRGIMVRDREVCNKWGEGHRERGMEGWERIVKQGGEREG